MDLLFARLQMAVSLGFHIIFAAAGIAMPFFMAVSHYRWLKTKDPLFLELTKAWSRGVAIFFAIGAVSGTALSIELGLLWPTFMKHAGPIIGMPFSWEGTAFFIEAIAIGFFLYGWNKVQPWVHWGSGLVVGLAGVTSGLFVVCVNGWMNAPVGFEIDDHGFSNIDPVAAMFNPAALRQGIHMTIAAFQAIAIAVAGFHALILLKRPNLRIHLEGLKIALLVASIASIVQPFTGHLIAQQTARLQPEKLAAMEAHFETSTYAPLLIGGIPDVDSGTVSYGIKIPGLLSFLAFDRPSAIVRGLHDFPKSNWPPVAITHFAFQIMVGIGSLLTALSIATLFILWKRSSIIHSRAFLIVATLCTPLGVIAMEAGWVVTEVGRQPWIIYHIMRTADAVTPMPGIVYPFAIFVTLYLSLAGMVAWLMVRQVRALHRRLEMSSHDSAEETPA